MSDGGYPVIGSEASDSPVPAEYGSLDAGFPSAAAEVRDRRRSAPPAEPRTVDPAPTGRGGIGSGRARGGGGGDGGGNGVAAPPVGPPLAPAAPPAVAPGPPLARPVAAPGAPGVPGPGEPGRGVAPRVPGPGSSPGIAVAVDPRRRERVPSTVRYSDADIIEGPVRGRRRRRQKVRVVRGVRSKRLVRRIDVWTVLKVSFVFYLLVLAALVAAGVIVWNVAAALGFIHTIEKSLRTLFSLKVLVLHPQSSLVYGSAMAGLLCLVGVLVNVLSAVAYNLISDFVGGVQVVVVTEVD